MSDTRIVDLGQYVYFPDRRLGQPGGQASVYLGMQKPPLERRAAIKILHEQHAADPALREAFLREARCYAALTHPNIVNVFGCDVVDGRSFIAMELVEGYDLRTWLRERDREHPIPHEIALLILQGVGRALEAAHGATPPVAHRDLKPGNIMLSVQGLVKLADFGLALVGDSQGTITGTLKGSPPYMSPEQTRGIRLDSQAAQRSDLFSFGVVAYELFTGSNPFFRGDAVETMSAVRDLVLPPLGERNPRLAGALGEAVDRALDKDPARRGPGIGALVDLIEDALDTSKVGRQRNLLRSYMLGHGCPAEPIPAERGWPPPGPDPTLPGGGDRTVPFAPVTGGASGGGSLDRSPAPQPSEPGSEHRSAPPASPQPEPPAPTPPRPRPPVAVGRIAATVGAVVFVAVAVVLAWTWPRPPKVTTAQLIVDSVPQGATILVDGRRCGTTRDTVPGLRPGIVRLRLELPGYVAVEEATALNPGPNSWFRQLAPLDTVARTYRVITTPGFANVSVDGGPMRTQHPITVSLSPGPHSFHLVNRGLKVDCTLEHEIPPQDTARRLFLNFETQAVEPRR